MALPGPHFPNRTYLDKNDVLLIRKQCRPRQKSNVLEEEKRRLSNPNIVCHEVEDLATILGHAFLRSHRTEGLTRETRYIEIGLGSDIAVSPRQIWIMYSTIHTRPITNGCVLHKDFAPPTTSSRPGPLWAIPGGTRPHHPIQQLIENGGLCAEFLCATPLSSLAASP